MRPSGATHWLLDHRTGWRTASSKAVVVGPELCLPARVHKGTWTSRPLDGGTYRCVWDRVVLDVARLAPRDVIEVWTATRDTEPSHQAPEPEWTFCGRVSGADGTRTTVDWPVGARPGRHLVVRIEFASPTADRPALSAVRAHYPRQSSVDFLPAVFSADRESHGLLARFLGALDVEWDGLAERIRSLPSLVDPGAVPPGSPMLLLAGWLGVPDPPGGGDESGRRRWLRAAIGARSVRGTPAALRNLLVALLANLTGVDPTTTHYPVFVEGRADSRPWLTLNHPVRGRLNRARLWGPNAVGRLRIGSYSQVGRARLIGTGDPVRDRTGTVTTGHRFRVYLPKVWHSKERETLIRALIDGERPATSPYDLVWVESHTTISTQSTVGVNTIITPDTLVHVPRAEGTAS